MGRTPLQIARAAEETRRGYKIKAAKYDELKKKIKECMEWMEDNAEHTVDCLSYDYFPAKPCNCGLAELLKGVE